MLARLALQCHFPRAEMLPERKKEAAEAGGSRGGFEVHVIGGSAPAAATVESAGPGMEFGLVIGAGTKRNRVASESDGAPVLRLEAEENGEPLKARAMSEVGPAVPRAGSRSRRKRPGLQRLTLWMGIGVCAATVVAVGGLMALRKGDAEAKLPTEAPVSPEVLSPAQVEEAYFLDHSNELIVQAEGMLRKYASAASADEALPFLREKDRLRSVVQEKWKPWSSNPKFSAADGFVSAIDVETARPSVIVTGSKGDFSPFSAIFTRENGKLVLDWEATEGIGELQIADLRGGAVASETMVRAVVSPSDYFTPDFPEARYRSYKLIDASGDQLVWAYVAVDSPVAAALKSGLNEDSFIMKANSGMSLTLKLSGPLRPGSNQYQITEMLHKGWVSP
jgi:hypothetical protein